MSARHEARQRFLPPLLAHLQSAGLGHVSEIADADAPFAPKGCPFQAWSLGEPWAYRGPGDDDSAPRYGDPRG